MPDFFQTPTQTTPPPQRTETPDFFGGAPTSPQAPSASPSPAPSKPSGVFDVVRSALGKVEDVTKTGVSDLLRATRVPQEASVSAILKFVVEHGRLPNPGEWWTAANAAVSSDESPSDVLKKANILDSSLKGTLIGLAADIVVDPMWIFAPAKVARLARLPQLVKMAKESRVVQDITRPIGESRFVQKLGRQLINPDIGKPAEYVTRRDKFEAAVIKRGEESLDLGRRINKLSPEEQRVVTAYMTAGPAARNSVLMSAQGKGLRVDLIKELGDEAIRRDMEFGRHLVEQGIISEETYQKWAGRHIYREYRKYASPREWLEALWKENPEAAAIAEAEIKGASGFVGSTAQIRQRLAAFRQRQDIPEKIRKEVLQEIEEAAHPVAKGQMIAGREIETRKFLSDVAETWGQDTYEAGYKRLEGKSFGPLDGKYVPEAIADDLQSKMRTPGGFERFYRTWLARWKFGKIALSPAGHARIILHNWLLADLAGVGPTFKPWRYGQALRELVQKGEYYKMAEESGLLLHGTQAERDLDALLPAARDLKDGGALESLVHNAGSAMDHVTKVAATIPNAAKSALKFEDRIFKMAVFIDYVKQGKTAEEATRLTDLALLNYHKLPVFVDSLRRWGVVPFVAFPFQASQRVARGLIHAPASMGKYGKIFKTVEASGGLSPQQIGAERSVMPDYMGGGAGWIRLPWKTGGGKSEYLNVGYVLPFWIPYESLKEGARLTHLLNPYRHAGQGQLTTEPKGVFNVTGYPLAQALIEQKDPMTGKPLQHLGDYLDWLYKFLTPTFAPPIPGITKGGIGTESLINAQQGRPSNILSRRPTYKTVPDVLERYVGGVVTHAFDPTQERAYRMLDLQKDVADVKHQLSIIGHAPALHDPNTGNLTPEGQRLKVEQLDRLRVIHDEAMRLQHLDFKPSTDTRPANPATPEAPTPSAPTGPADFFGLPKSSAPARSAPTTDFFGVARPESSFAPSDLRQAVVRFANQYGVPGRLANALVSQESGFHANARSSAGAIGPMQLMPGTARMIGVDPYDPIRNIQGGMMHLARLYRKYRRWDLALAAYNAGEGAVDKYGGRVPPYAETQQYVRSILGAAGMV